jgi:adenine deaminase
VGALADLTVLKTLEGVAAKAVFVGGTLVAEKGRLAEGEKQKFIPAPACLLKSVKLDPVERGDLTISAPRKNPKVKVNVIDFSQKITELAVDELPVSSDGSLRLPESGDFACLVVFNRYGSASKGAGVLKNFGLTGGAVASTVSHDSHNLAVAFRDVDDAVKAVNAVVERNGGVAVSLDGELEAVDLPVGGLISELPAPDLTSALGRFEPLYYRTFGGKQVSLLKVATTSLIVSPKFKVSDMGIVDVLQQKIVPLFPEP